MTVSRAGRVTFVLGGARSGKSVFSENLAAETGLERHYIATSQIWDAEMAERVALHRTQRGEGWITHEVPLDLASTLLMLDAPDRVILVDCLTLWVTNLMMADRAIADDTAALVDSLAETRAQVIFVSNEVGLGIVPDNKMARQFRDHAGRLHQRLAATADRVFFIAAGLPLTLKG